MKYSIRFPTHGVFDSSVPGLLARLFQQSPYRLDEERQAIVARAIAEVCLDQGWSLEKVETAYMSVSVVVECFAEPGKVVHHFKVAASRALALLDGKGPERRRFNRRAEIVRLMDTDLPPRHWLEANRHSADGSSRLRG